MNFLCENCGHKTTKWFGQCPKCKEYNTMSEFNEIKTKNYNNVILKKLDDIELKDDIRIKTEIIQIDNILGGGFVLGSINLLAGSPGIGKSTIILQIINNIVKRKKVLYVTSEESLSQVKVRANRLGIKGEILFLYEADIDIILDICLQNKIDFLIIDSIQTTYTTESISMTGSVNQLKNVTFKLMNFSKQKNITTVVVGHITKDGDIAGPKLLEHMVDVVIHFEGDKGNKLRSMKTPKNRFGNTTEIAVLKMEESGLKEFDINKKLLLDKLNTTQVGAAIGCIEEGNNTIFLETQALTAQTVFGAPKRSGQGIENTKLQLLVGLIISKTNIDLTYTDVYVKLFGGLKTSNPNIDLALLMAICSSKLNKELHKNTLFIGEVNLTGQIKTHGDIVKVLKLAKSSGFKDVFIGKSDEVKIPGINVHSYPNVKSVIEKVWS